VKYLRTGQCPACHEHIRPPTKSTKAERVAEKKEEDAADKTKKEEKIFAQLSVKKKKERVADHPAKKTEKK
jgi:hypothetical protein